MPSARIAGVDASGKLFDDTIPATIARVSDVTNQIAAAGITPAIAATIALKADDSTVVHLAGTETIGGVKTFTLAPVIPDAALEPVKVNGLVAALAASVNRAPGATVGQIWGPLATPPDPSLAQIGDLLIIVQPS